MKKAYEIATSMETASREASGMLASYPGSLIIARRCGGGKESLVSIVNLRV